MSQSIHLPIHEPTEKGNYFDGLPQQQEILARSDDHVPWVEKKYTNWVDPTLRGLIRPVGDHPIVDAWNKGMSGRLLPDIVEALRGIQWNTMDVLQVCYPSAAQSTPTVTEEERVGTVTVFIIVPNNSIALPDALHVAKECKAILVRHGIHDVECEVKQCQERVSTASDIMETYKRRRRNHVGSCSTSRLSPVA